MRQIIFSASSTFSSIKCSAVILCLIMLAGVTTSTSAQDPNFNKYKQRLRIPKEDQKWLYGLKAGLSANGSFEAGGFISKGYDFHKPSYAFAISNEFGGEGGAFNPKISAEGYLFVFIGRISMVDYIQDQTHDVRLRPELGLTLFGIISFCIGWDMYFNQNLRDEHDLSRTGSLIFHLPFNTRRFHR